MLDPPASRVMLLRRTAELRLEGPSSGRSLMGPVLPLLPLLGDGAVPHGSVSRLAEQGKSHNNALGFRVQGSVDAWGMEGWER